MPQVNPLLKQGEVVISGVWARRGDKWTSIAHVKVRRWLDSRDLDLPVPGREFDTEAEAMSAAMHAGMDWVKVEFPLP